MKKFFSFLLALIFFLGTMHPGLVTAATLTDFLLEGDSDETGASGVTYVISFTTVTEVPASERILYAIWPSGFVVPTDQNDVIITVDGVSQTIDAYGNWSSNLQFISISNTVSSGSDVVVTINNVTNANTAGLHTFTWVRTANSGGHAIDEASPTPTITLASTNRTLTYSSGTGGTLSGSTSQTVADGGNGSAVTAIPNNGYYFIRWSDGSTQNPRIDTAVSGDISVSAVFAQNAPRPVIAPVGAFQKDPTFKINNGDSETTKRDVVLTFDVHTDSVAYYAVSQDPNMHGVSQQNFIGSAPFTLADTLGEQKVYVYLYSTTGHPSKLLEQTITLIEESTPVVLQEQETAESTTVSTMPEAEAVSTTTLEDKNAQTAVPTAEKTSYQFTRNLRIGDFGEDVGKLREFLHNRGYNTTTVPYSELGSVELQTFGSGLKQAVAQFQEQHPEEILVPLELTKGTGNFFEYTRAFVNNQIK